MTYSTTNVYRMKREIITFSKKISSCLPRTEQKFFTDMLCDYALCFTECWAPEAACSARLRTPCMRKVEKSTWWIGTQGDGPFVLTICVRSRTGFLSSGRFDGLTGPHSSTPGCISRGTLRRSQQRLSAPLRQRACIIDCRLSYR